MKVAIIGLELAGKTTLFGALTRGQAAAGRPGESHLAVVEVPDRRFDTLIEIYNPRKQARAAVEFVDGAGAAGGPRFGAAFLADVRASDALVHVARAFDNPAVPVTRGADPLRDVRDLDAELILADLDLVEKRLDRQKAALKNRPKGTAADSAVELDVLTRLKDHLESELPARAFHRTAQEEEATRHLLFLSGKPVALVANIDEGEIGSQKTSGTLDALQEYAERAGYPLLDICAKVESEVAQLPPEEEISFLEAMGVAESGRYRLIRTVYDLLGLHCFFTVGEDEVKAWTIRRGDSAVTAAGKIHSDLARGFIRAEVIPFDALVAAGDPKAARDAGHFRLEQKPYVVQDGDIMNIRFSV